MTVVIRDVIPTEVMLYRTIIIDCQPTPFIHATIVRTTHPPSPMFGTTSGAGFVTSHFAYTLMYEKALQAVDPRYNQDTHTPIFSCAFTSSCIQHSVIMPYWDFTLESTFYEPNDWRNSPVFGSDWFGDASPPNNLHIVTEGRWGFNPVLNEDQRWLNFKCKSRTWCFDVQCFVAK